MPLIKCPECGDEISDKATTCPRCGRTITSEDDESTTWKGKLWIAVVCCSSFFIFKGCFGLLTAHGKGNGTSVEEVARMIAEANTKVSEAMQGDDPTLVGTRFWSEGKTVYMEYINATKANLSREEIAAFDAAVVAEVLPRSCRANQDNPAFPFGLRYVMRYRSNHGHLLSEFVVDKSVCDSVR